ncbi:MAG: hypothetical protein FVQ77_03715 [Cytophagales bacterium]|nr:hypothetical protein [Cytophagales bacterium]
MSLWYYTSFLGIVLSIQHYPFLIICFQKEGIVGISTVDTRSIVRHIRNKGAMNAVISSETTDLNFLKEELKQLPSMKGLELASKISTKKIYDQGDKNASYKVAVLDLGVKKSILTE